MKIITIIGARPQFIKAAMFSHAIAEHNRLLGRTDIEEKILHTGQHYDYEMSGVFFDRMAIPAPQWNLGCTLPPQEMSQQILPILECEHPDWVVVFGDTNSTLAGALAAQVCGIPIAHIEAGLRSFNSHMAEEYNRVQTDRLATCLFCPTRTAVDNLRKEGIVHHVVNVGDIMYDAALQTPTYPHELEALHLPENFLLVTVHRAENTDQFERLSSILTALVRLQQPIVWPMHPRTKKVIDEHREWKLMLQNAPHIQVIESQSYEMMAALEQKAKMILTDSGGVQKEAYFHRTPCVTLRRETEWVETVESGWNQLVDCDIERIIHAVEHPMVPQHDIQEYGDGHTAQKIVEYLCAY